MSIPEFDNTIPVNPPNVNKTINPLANNIGVFNTILPVNIVAIQLKILITVGTAIIIVAAVKYARVSTSKPTVYMWCAQTIKPRNPIDNIAYIIPLLPKVGFMAK
jgi:hypothetical protein